MKYVGIDIGGTKCAVSLGNESGEILNKVSFGTTDVTQTLHRIFDAVRDMGQFDAIGISCGGPLDAAKGIIMSPPNLPGWDNIPIKDMLVKEFAVPVFLQNDADACALAEWKYGAGKDTKNMIFLTFGTGMGAGLILNGALYPGTSGMAGEIGHVRMRDDGPVGYGKAGSFEGFCSGGGIAKLGMQAAKEMLQNGKIPSFCESMADISHITAKRIADCAHAGNEDARNVYRECARMLGYGLSILIDVLNPEKIIIGSIFVRSQDLLTEEMNQVLEKECLPQALKACQIVPAALGEKLGDVAALSVAVVGMNMHLKDLNDKKEKFTETGE